MAQVTLDTYAGLVSAVDPTSLPEGASPRTYDTDFATGGWRQRPGQQNVYSYSGQSAGPNPAFVAVDTPLGNVIWSNPGNILLDDGNYATATPSGTGQTVLAPFMTSSTWSSPVNATSATLYSHYTSGSPSVLTATVAPFTLPSGAAITGIGFALDAYSPTFGQLLGGVEVGGFIEPGIFVALGASPALFSFGGNGVLWGAVGSQYFSGFSVLLFPELAAQPFVNNLVITVYYTVPVLSDYLDVTNFTFGVPSTQSITGVLVSLKGMSDSAQTASVQLLAGGVAIDPPKTYTLPSSTATQVLGGSTDQWQASLSSAIVNGSDFGVRIQVAGMGTVSFDYVTVELFLTSANVNFNYIGPLTSQDGTEYNLALDAQGNWWMENCTTGPGSLVLALSGTPAGSYGCAVSVYDRAFIANSTLLGQVTGVDIPRQYNLAGGWWDRVTQVGPAAPPVVSASQASGAVAAITSVSIASNIATVAAINAYVAGEVGTFSGLTGGVTGLNGQTLIVLSAGLSGTQFEVAFNNGGGAVGPVAQAGAVFTPQYTYPVATITQPAQMSDPSSSGHVNALLWSAGPGNASAGNTITVYYSDSFTHTTPDSVLVNAFNSGFPVYVYITGQPFGNGVWQVTSIGNAIPPGAGYFRWYFTYQVPTSSYQFFGGPDNAQGFYQLTQGTITLSAPVPGISGGSQISIAAASVPAWDGVYNIVRSLNSGAFNVTQTALSGGVATYTWALTSGAAPAAGQLVTISNTLNANGILNVTDAIIATASGTSSGTFTVSGFAANLNYVNTVEEGQATTAGTQFIIDPGAANLGSTTVNPIFGNSTGGTLTVVGAAGGGTLPIGAGTRQGVVIFITRNGLYTAPSPPVTFTVAQGSNYVQISSVAIGPPDVIGRLFACTEAGQLGIPGDNFYTTTIPTIFQVGGVQYTSNSFLIPDNTTTTAKFTFSDEVLLKGDAIDIPGNNLFNLIEIGNPAAILQYAERTFYIGCQNKVQNFNNLSFDGGYLQPQGGGPIVPLGWFIDPSFSSPFGPAFNISSFSITSNVVTMAAVNSLSPGLNVLVNGLSTGTYLNGVTLNVLTASSTQFTAAFTHANLGATTDAGTVKTISAPLSLRQSPVFGNSLYVVNQSAVTQAIMGLISQSAYQDAYNAPILNPHAIPVPYSVRVTCRCPSGASTGQLLIGLAVNNALLGAFVVTFAQMSTQMQTFTGEILPTGFPTIPANLQLQVYGEQMPPLSDYEIDRIEVFPTNQPVLTNTVLVSYPQEPEQVDGVSGQLTLNSRSQDPVYGATIIRDQLCFKKRNSIIETEDAPNYEPDKWTTREVSQRGSGACGPYAFAQGDEWDLGMNKQGIYVYSGAQPMPISRELQGFPGGVNLWDAIEWNVSQSFWLANDTRTRRIYAGVAMKTPNFWLPNAPTDFSPEQPNVILMCNYEGCPTAQELEAGAPVHTTMFGSVKALDMRRKWSIWQIAAPYGGNAFDSTYGYESLYLCNGIESSKIYRLQDCSLQPTDDGVPITPLYTTYALPDKDKGTALGIGSGQKYATRFMGQIAGSAAANQLQIRHFQDTLNDKYPVTAAYVPPLTPDQQHNIEWRSEVRGQRIFLEFSMNRTGTPASGWVEMSELMTDIVAHPWGAFRGVSA